jgi:hypothetical protein
MAEDAAARHMLDAAERAATAGDFASAYDLLRGALRHQEKKLGARHPDLANTLNNLAVVAERTGREKEAEPLYRRAASIAQAAFPADHPMVVASRQNLEDFCHARGLSIDAPAAPDAPDTGIAPVPQILVPPESETRLRLDAVPEDIEPAAPAGPVRDAVTDDVTMATTPTAPRVPVPDARVRQPVSSQSSLQPPGANRVSRSLIWVAGAVGIVLIAALLVWRSGSSRDEARRQPEPAAARPDAAEPQPPAPAVPGSGMRDAGSGTGRGTPGPAGHALPPTVPPAGKDRNGNTSTPAAGSAVTIVTAEVCRTFSTSGGHWRCDPVGNSVAPGRVVFYTRLRSTRNAAVLHQWYRGSTLRRAVKLTTRANAREGYRTYSRQTVDKGEWRVELRTANGDLLHEQRFVVR